MLNTAIRHLERLYNWLRGPNPEFALIGKNARLPTHGSAEAAALDLYSPVKRRIEPGFQTKIPLGIASQFRRDWEAQIWDRSGLGSKGIHRLCGLIDSDYRGEWAVVLFNLTNKEYVIEKGDRIAQVTFVPCWTDGCREVPSVRETARGVGGFGSTGR